jgi:hypothetical protein
VGRRCRFAFQVLFQNLVNELGHPLAFPLGRGVELADKPVVDFGLVHFVTFLLSKNLWEAYQAGGKLKGWRTCCERQSCTRGLLEMECDLSGKGKIGEGQKRRERQGGRWKQKIGGCRDLVMKEARGKSAGL